MKREEARRKAFEYWVSHYGNLIQIDDDNAVFSGGYWAFILHSNYPRNRLNGEMYITKCEYLGEIVVHPNGTIVSATPRNILVKRLKKYLDEGERL